MRKTRRGLRGRGVPTQRQLFRRNPMECVGGRWALRNHCLLRLHLPIKGSHLCCWGNLSLKPPNKDAIPPHRKQWGILA